MQYCLTAASTQHRSVQHRRVSLWRLQQGRVLVLVASAAAATGSPLIAPAALPSEQQAVVQVGAAPDALELQAVPVPSPEAGQVLIRVYAASVNPADWQPHEPGGDERGERVPGLDVAGVVAAVGAGVSDRPVGLAVFGIVDHTDPRLNGGYAHYALARASSTAPKPRRLSYAQAAGLGVVGVTALRAVDEAGIHAGQRLLITGIAGGVGSTVAQIAHARGALVLGTASPRHDAYLRSIGVSKVIDYARSDVAAQAGAIDAVIDTVGGNEALETLPALKPGGRFVTVARAQPGTGRCQTAHVECLGSPGHAAEAPLSVLLQVAELAETGELSIHIDRTYPLAQAVEALRYNHAGHTQGKVIIAVTPQAQAR